MSRTKADLSLVSLNQLTALTGKTYRTLKKLLAELPPASTEGDVLLYSPSEALPIIYGVDLVTQRLGDYDAGGTPVLDPAQEKARLDRLRADKVDLEIQVMKKSLVPRERVEQSWTALLGNFRSKILNLPAKVSPKVCATKSVKEVQKILTEECRQALAELSEYDDGFDRPRAQPEGL